MSNVKNNNCIYNFIINTFDIVKMIKCPNTM